MKLNKTTYWIIGLVLLLLIAVYFWGRTSNNEPVKIDWDGIKSPDGLDLSLNEKQLIESLLIITREKLTTNYWWDASSRCDLYKELYELDAELLIALASLYSQTYETTIRQGMDNTYTSGCTLTQWDDKLIEKFDFLNIP